MTETKNQSNKGSITDIQRFSVHDGPGIRTVIFFKGCPLRCGWCQNPETNQLAFNLMYEFEHCIGCESCVTRCRQQAIHIESNGNLYTERELCRSCGSCCSLCFSGARHIVGRTVSVDEVINEVLKDIVFYNNSGGGMTLSGGEVLLQSTFANNLLAAAKQIGINTVIETSGFGKRDELKELLANTDLVLFDIKHIDSEIHEKYTGVENSVILDNLRYTVENGSQVIARYPLIPGFNDDEETINRVGQLVSELDIKEIHILPFHQAGSSKWVSLDFSYDYVDVAGIDIDETYNAREILSSLGLLVNIGGGGE